MAVTLSAIQAMPPEDRELLLDVGQVTLDIIGIFEPTPFADLTSGVVSLCRGEFLSGAISLVAIVPYAGDVAKLGKMPRYVQTVERAVQRARNNEALAKLARPLLARLLSALDALPLDHVNQTARVAIGRMRNAIDDFLGPARMMSRVEVLTEDVLRRVFGSTRNVGVLPRRNVRTIVEFFDKHKIDGGDCAKWAEKIKGIDLHAVDPVSVTTFRPGDLVMQYIDTTKPKGRQVGEWMVKYKGGVGPGNLGLSDAGRRPQRFRVRSQVETLRSRAAGAADHWTGAPINDRSLSHRRGTPGSVKPQTAIVVQDGRRVMTPAEHVAGGGEQFFLPEAWKYLEEW
jgi:hypothetical protein